MCCEWLPRREVTPSGSLPVFIKGPSPRLLPAALSCFPCHSFFSFPRFAIRASASHTPLVSPTHSQQLLLILHVFLSLLLFIAFILFHFVLSVSPPLPVATNTRHPLSLILCLIGCIQIYHFKICQTSFIRLFLEVNHSGRGCNTSSFPSNKNGLRVDELMTRWELVSDITTSAQV